MLFGSVAPWHTITDSLRYTAFPPGTLKSMIEDLAHLKPLRHNPIAALQFA